MPILEQLWGESDYSKRLGMALDRISGARNLEQTKGPTIRCYVYVSDFYYV